MRLKRGYLVCLTGIDGSGKTTLSHRLPVLLGQQGMEYKYVYARFLPMLVRPLWAVARKLFLRKHDMISDYEGYSSAKTSLFRQGIAARLQESMVLVDYFIQVTFKVTIPLLLGKNLVCDRYVYDTVVSDLAVDLHYTLEQVEDAIDFYFRVMPRPGLVFFLDVPEDVSLQRKSDVPTREYLTHRRAIYRIVKDAAGVITLDGTLSPEQLEREALAIIARRLA